MTAHVHDPLSALDPDVMGLEECEYCDAGWWQGERCEHCSLLSDHLPEPVATNVPEPARRPPTKEFPHSDPGEPAPAAVPDAAE